MEDCRLCGAPVTKLFEKRVLGKYQVAYSRCVDCGSLQAAEPYWLEEAYDSALVRGDTGAVYRSFNCHSAIVAIARVLNLRGTFVDYGGGGGLLCRLLRDTGFNAYTTDKYADPIYARGFVWNLEQVAKAEVELISAIEVFEHCPKPQEEIGRLFSLRPRVLIATTSLYAGEDQDWWYIGAQYGQHIFFYSERALRMLAERYGYTYFGSGGFHLFSTSPLTLLQRQRLRFVLSRWGLRAVSILIATTRRRKYAEADFARMCTLGSECDGPNKIV